MIGAHVAVSVSDNRRAGFVANQHCDFRVTQSTFPRPRHEAGRWFILAYLTRWSVEETMRFIKQSYRLEDLWVLDYERLRNLGRW